MKRSLVAALCILSSVLTATPVLGAPNYSHYRGYRHGPYDTHRHYDRFVYREHPYAYRGHWRSWRDWEAYKRHYPKLYTHGGYYRDHGHLMFRYCDPHGGSCFFFSIGR
jgi:hypothetical protein